MAVPPNDDIQNAIAIGNGTGAGTAITLNQVDFQDATFATGEPDPALHGSETNSVWYTYTPDTTGTATFTTDNPPSNNDTVLAAYTLTDSSAPAAYSNLTNITFNDDDGNNTTQINSTISFNAVAGQTYYIQLGAFNNVIHADVTTTVTGPNASCFTSGTLIRTNAGEVAIEALRVGNELVTSDGDTQVIRWIGKGVIDFRAEPDRLSERPILIEAEALGRQQPHTDLVVSPGHRICLDLLDEVFVTAMDLVNGCTVRQLEVDSVTYWHVELDRHEVIFANGQATESYENVGNRAFFGIGRGAPDQRGDTDGNLLARPVISDPATLHLIRERLKARAVTTGWRLVAPTLDGVHLLVDGKVIHPDILDRSMRFVVPAKAREAWLVSAAREPIYAGGSLDHRQLGLAVIKVLVDDGIGMRTEISASDERLAEGFYSAEQGPAGTFRWTNGRARLDRALWAGCQGQFFLRFDLAITGVPHWVSGKDAAPALAVVKAA